MAYDLPFTAMGAMIDAAAVNGCIASGLIVIVEVDKFEIAGIVSAHTSREEAYNAYLPYELNTGYAIIVPQEAGPAMFYNWLTKEELDNACRM